MAKKKRSSSGGRGPPMAGVIALIAIIAAAGGIAYTTLKGKGKSVRSALGVVEPQDTLPNALFLKRVQPHQDIMYTMNHISRDESNGLGVQYHNRRGQVASHLGSLGPSHKDSGSMWLINPSPPLPIKMTDVLMSDPCGGGSTNLGVHGVPIGKKAFP